MEEEAVLSVEVSPVELGQDVGSGEGSQSDADGEEGSEWEEDEEETRREGTGRQTVRYVPANMFWRLDEESGRVVEVSKAGGAPSRGQVLKVLEFLGVEDAEREIPQRTRGATASEKVEATWQALDQHDWRRYMTVEVADEGMSTVPDRELVEMLQEESERRHVNTDELRRRYEDEVEKRRQMTQAQRGSEPTAGELVRAYAEARERQARARAEGGAKERGSAPAAGNKKREAAVKKQVAGKTKAKGGVRPRVLKTRGGVHVSGLEAQVATNTGGNVTFAVGGAERQEVERLERQLEEQEREVREMRRRMEEMEQQRAREAEEVRERREREQQEQTERERALRVLDVAEQIRRSAMAGQRATANYQMQGMLQELSERLREMVEVLGLGRTGQISAQEAGMWLGRLEELVRYLLQQVAWRSAMQQARAHDVEHMNPAKGVREPRQLVEDMIATRRTRHGGRAAAGAQGAAVKAKGEAVDKGVEQMVERLKQLEVQVAAARQQGWEGRARYGYEAGQSGQAWHQWGAPAQPMPAPAQAPLRPQQQWHGQGAQQPFQGGQQPYQAMQQPFQAAPYYGQRGQQGQHTQAPQEGGSLAPPATTGRVGPGFNAKFTCYGCGMLGYTKQWCPSCNRQ